MLLQNFRRDVLMLVVLAAISGGIGSGSSKTDGLVDINQATVTELLRVPGMTPVWAARIVRFRPYRTKLDLLEQGVVTPEAYRRIRDRIVAHRLEATRNAGQEPH